MLYRAIFGMIPLLVVALCLSGAIPLSAVLPTGTVTAPPPEIIAEQIKAERVPPIYSRAYEIAEPATDVREKARKRLERMRAERLRRREGTKWAPEDKGWSVSRP